MPIPVSAPPALRAERLSTAADIRAAQRLRAEVFGSTYGVHFADNLDQDAYDAHCLHLGVRDLRSGELIATTRLLDGRRRERLGQSLQRKRIPAGKAWTACRVRCWKSAAPAWRPGIAPARPSPCCGRNWPRSWPAATTANLMGCASVPMADGGLQAAALLRQAARDERIPAIRARRGAPLPFVAVPDNLVVQLPPLLKAYLRLAPRSAARPCWDPEFGVPTSSSCSSAKTSAHAMPATSRPRYEATCASPCGCCRCWPRCCSGRCSP